MPAQIWESLSQKLTPEMWARGKGCPVINSLSLKSRERKKERQVNQNLDFLGIK
jgi:hypothetical protein